MAKAEKAGKKKLGRPSGFNDAISERIYELARLGKTDAEISSAIGVTSRTLNYWKAKNDNFFQTLRDNKAVADGFVEASLFQRACGYSHPETKVFYDAERGEVVEHEVMKHYPPDSTAMIFWLKNRQPERWRDQPEQINEMEMPKPVYELIESKADKPST